MSDIWSRWGGDPTKLQPQTRSVLENAMAAAENATGGSGRILETWRPMTEQAQFYANRIGRPFSYNGTTYQPDPSKIGHPAAYPGPNANHPFGWAADFARGPQLSWMHAHIGEFPGLEAVAGDYPHLQYARALRTSPVPVGLTMGIPVPKKPMGVDDALAIPGKVLHAAISFVRTPKKTAQEVIKSFTPSGMGMGTGSSGRSYSTPGSQTAMSYPSTAAQQNADLHNPNNTTYTPSNLL